MELVEAISAYQVVGLDASVFIYGFQEHPQFLPVVRPLFERLDTDPAFRAVTSVVTLIEVIVHPLQLNRQDLLATYMTALLNTPNVVTYAVDVAIARRAAELRSRFNLRTPDAIQVATAIIAGAQAFITNDLRLRRVTDIPILVIADFAQ